MLHHFILGLIAVASATATTPFEVQNSLGVGGYPTVLKIEAWGDSSCTETNTTFLSWRGYCLVPSDDCSQNLIYHVGGVTDQAGTLYAECDDNPNGDGGVVRLYPTPQCTTPLMIGNTYSLTLNDQQCVPITNTTIVGMNSVMGTITMSSASTRAPVLSVVLLALVQVLLRPF